MASTILFATGNQIKWIGHNSVLWTIVEFLHRQKNLPDTIRQAIQFTSDTTLNFCDFSMLPEQDLRSLRSLLLQLHETFDSHWNYKLPAHEHQEKILEIVATLDTKLAPSENEHDN